MAPILCDLCRDIVFSQANARTEGEETININSWDPLDELTQLDALLARLTIKREELKGKINRIYSPIIRQLPPDVMSIIFEFCLLDFTKFYRSPSRSDLCIPLTLGAVCKYWREIAWSTPSLWSSLIVDVSRTSHPTIAQEWLARSGQLPLSIRIISKPHIFFTPVHRVAELADITNQYSTRWSHFELCLPQSHYRYFHPSDNHAPILKTIRFHNYSDVDVAPEHNTDFHLTCPRLQRAFLSQLQMNRIHIQWDNLTHLYLHQIRMADCLFILRKTPRLVFCSFSSWYGFGVSPPVAPTLTSLRCLRVKITDSSAQGFFEYLICPQLEELSLSSTGNFAAPPGLISSHISRPACSLRSFSITDTFIPGSGGLVIGDIVTLLTLMPSLKKLSITLLCKSSPPGYFDSWNILQVLAKVLSSQSTGLPQGFLPNLESLEYTGKLCLRPGNYADLYSFPPINNVILPLRVFKLDLDLYPATRIPANAISFFLGLVEQGLTVNVLSKSEDLLQSSIKYYGHREECLRRDWVDDLDLTLMSWFLCRDSLCIQSQRWYMYAKVIMIM